MRNYKVTRLQLSIRWRIFVICSTAHAGGTGSCPSGNVGRRRRCQWPRRLAWRSRSSNYSSSGGHEVVVEDDVPEWIDKGFVINEKQVAYESKNVKKRKICVSHDWQTDRRTSRDELELELVHWRSGIILSSSHSSTSASATELLTLMCVPFELAPIVANRLCGFLIRIEQPHLFLSLSLRLSFRYDLWVIFEKLFQISQAADVFE